MITADLLIELAWKSLLVGGAALGLLRLARRRSAAERSWIAHCGLAALLLLIPAVLLAPSWNPVPLPAFGSTAEPVAVAPAQIKLPELAHATSPPAGAVANAPAATAEWALPSAGELAVWLYAVPLVLLMLAMLVAVIRLFAMHRRAAVLVEAPWLAALAQAQRRMGFKHGTALLVSEELNSPVSWGMMRPIILLNPDVVSASRDAEAIIAHELAHVARLDWAKLLLARVACAVFWFNPLVWLLARESHQLREEAADDAVLLSDVDGTDYASLLVNAARHDNQALLLAAHGVAPARDSLKRRITRVLDDTLTRRQADLGWIALCMVVVVGVAGPLAALDPATAPGERAGLVSFAQGSPARGDSSLVADAVASQVARIDDDLSALHDEDDDTDDERDSDVDRLIEMKAVGLSPEYIAAMREAGFTGSADDLVEARAVGVSPDFARAIRSIAPQAELDEIVEARAVGVTPEFARDMRRLAPGIDLDEVVEARAVGLTPEYVGQMRGLFSGLDLEEAVEMAAVGVSADYVRSMRSMFPRLTADQAVELKAVGVTPTFVEQMRREGLPVRDPDEAVEGRVIAEGLRGYPGRGPGPGAAGPRPPSPPVPLDPPPVPSTAD